MVNLAAGLAVATVALGYAEKGFTMMYEAVARSEALEDADAALLAFAGNSAKAASMMNAVRDAADGMLSKFGATQAATRILSLGLASTADEAAHLTELAVSLGDAFGKEAGPAVEDFTNMLATGRVLGLKEYGISVADVTKRTKELMAATKGLTEAEAKQIAIIQVADEKLQMLKDSGYEAGDATAQLTAAWEDFTDGLAEAAGRAFGPTIKWLADVISKQNEYNDLLEQGTTETGRFVHVLGIAADGGSLYKDTLSGLYLSEKDVTLAQAHMNAEAEYWARYAAAEAKKATDELGGEFDDAATEAVNFFESIDRGIGNTIQGFIEDLNFKIAGGIRFQEISDRIVAALNDPNNKITDVQARAMFINAYIEEQAFEAELGTITAEEAAANIAKTLGVELNKNLTAAQNIKAMLDSMDGMTVEITIAANMSLMGLGNQSGQLLPDFQQHGGPVYPGRSYVVGERRAELFTPTVSGNISPSVPSGGGVTLVFNYQPVLSTMDQYEIDSKVLPLLERGIKRMVEQTRV